MTVTRTAPTAKAKPVLRPFVLCLPGMAVIKSHGPSLPPRNLQQRGGQWSGHLFARQAGFRVSQLVTSQLPVDLSQRHTSRWLITWAWPGRGSSRHFSQHRRDRGRLRAQHRRQVPRVAAADEALDPRPDLRVGEAARPPVRVVGQFDDRAGRCRRMAAGCARAWRS